MKSRAVSLVISVLFHVVVLFLLIKISPSVRIYSYQEIAEVRIVSPEKIYMPRVGRFPYTGTVQEIPTEESPAFEEQQLSQNEMGEGQIYMSNLSIGENLNTVEDEPSILGGISPFRLNASSGKDSRFTLGTGLKEWEISSTYEGRHEDKLDLSSYYSDRLSSMPFNRMKSRRTAGGNRAGRRQQSILNSTENYDISPWVKVVVDKIRKNWSVPPIKESLAMGEVRIYITVRKNGELLGLEILNASDLVQFDETAIEAVQSSLPFPHLPEEFPYDVLEALLVFQFNE